MIPALGCLVLGLILWNLGSHGMLVDEPEYIIVDTSVCPQDVDYPRCGIDPVVETSRCSTNQDCNGRGKCCFYGCRRRCLQALKAKTASCPRRSSAPCGTNVHLPDECQRDKQCPGSSRCCGKCRLMCTPTINQRTEQRYRTSPSTTMSQEDQDDRAESSDY